MTYEKGGFIVDDAVAANSTEYQSKLKEGWSVVRTSEVGQSGFVTMAKREHGAARPVKFRMVAHLLALLASQADLCH